MFDKRPVAIPMLITCNTRVKTGRVKVNGNNCVLIPIAACALAAIGISTQLFP